MNLKGVTQFRYWPQLLALAVLLLGLFSYRYFAYHNTRSSDAYLSANVIDMKPAVEGVVTEVYVQDNQAIKKGDKILQIDSQPFLYEIQQAQASLKQAKLTNNNEQLSEAKSQLNLAHHRYTHSLMMAPVDGYITNFNIRPGQYVAKGESLFALIDPSSWWVVTRYRETALRLIKPGDKAKIKLDMYPGKIFHGKVESIGWGINRVQTGEVIQSPLRYMEPTEDWIEVAQRFPVIISIEDIDKNYPFRIGASATTTTYQK